MENIVSLSGGKDSTAMLHLMLEQGTPIDEVVFFDTGMEFPQMYDHLDAIERNTGLSITRLEADETFVEALLWHERKRGKRKGQLGFGWPTPLARWCTSLKTRTIDKHLRGREVRQFIGIAADEAHRCRSGFEYPLVDAGMTEADCLAYCKSLGYTWGGVYDHFKRVSCWCCPLQSIDELRMLRRHHPDLWDELMRLDNEVQRNPKPQLRFRADYDLPELEMRFRREERQQTLFGEEIDG